MVSLKEIYDAVKADFCGLLDYKLHGNTLEILTGIPTINNSMVSVFVSWDGSKFISSDGGWIDSAVYEQEEGQDEEMVSRITRQYIAYYDIKLTTNSGGIIYYYKTCSELKYLSAIVHDVGHFISMFVTAMHTKFSDPVADVAHSTQFQSKINKQLKSFYGARQVYPNYSMPLKNNRKIKLSAMLNVRTNQNLVYYCMMYITGNRKDLFIKDATKASINFKILGDAALPELYYERIAIINTKAPGYEKISSEMYLQELEEFTDRKPIYLDSYNLLPAISEVIQLPSGTIDAQ
ncbi:hypothetical protein [Spirosoma lituiforme]